MYQSNSSPIGRVLFPGVEASGLRKLHSWFPKKTEDACVVLVGGESVDKNKSITISKHSYYAPTDARFPCPPTAYECLC